MRLTFLGVRGSSPAPGAGFVRWGGHTSCVAITADGADGPDLVLDAGTGVRDLSPLLGGRPFAGALVLTHLHWDHVQGLPFSPALDHPEARVQLWVPVSGTPGQGARAQLERGMSPPHFPIDPGGLLGDWEFRDAGPGVLAAQTKATVVVAPVTHKGGETFGIRVELDGASVAYLPDHALDAALAEGGALLESATELVRGVDVLVHDGQFTDGERATALAYGHATFGATMGWADTAGVGELLFTHHGPNRDDERLDALAHGLRRTPAGRVVRFVRQGQTLVLP